MSKELIEAGALRQLYSYSADGLVFAYDKETTDRVFAYEMARWEDAYVNMKKFAEDNGLDTTTYGELK